jgi:hypothetical protein
MEGPVGNATLEERMNTWVVVLSELLTKTTDSAQLLLCFDGLRVTNSVCATSRRPRRLV